MRYPAVKVDIAANAELIDHRLQLRSLRSVANDVQLQSSRFQERVGGFQKHVGPLVGYETSDKCHLQWQRCRASPRSLEMLRINSILWNVDTLVFCPIW